MWLASIGVKVGLLSWILNFFKRSCLLLLSYVNYPLEKVKLKSQEVFKGPHIHKVFAHCCVKIMPCTYKIIMSISSHGVCACKKYHQVLVLLLLPNKVKAAETFYGIEEIDCIKQPVAYVIWYISNHNVNNAYAIQCLIFFVWTIRICFASKNLNVWNSRLIIAMKVFML